MQMMRLVSVTWYIHSRCNELLSVRAHRALAPEPRLGSSGCLYHQSCSAQRSQSMLQQRVCLSELRCTHAGAAAAIAPLLHAATADAAACMTLLSSEAALRARGQQHKGMHYTNQLVRDDHLSATMATSLRSCWPCSAPALSSAEACVLMSTLHMAGSSHSRHEQCALDVQAACSARTRLRWCTQESHLTQKGQHAPEQLRSRAGTPHI